MEEKNELKLKNSPEEHLSKFEDSFIYFLEEHNLPSQGIFVSSSERANVIRNLGSVLNQIGPKEKEQSLYLSKFIAAVASGLFDAALNYLWNETILQIRKRVIQYDLEYFYDNAVSEKKRKSLKGENDLIKVDDYELIKGSKEIGLISEVGFKHLEYINYMRNWVSAAHPNQNDIAGLQLIAWLETCVKEVISLPMSQVTIQIKKLLIDVKSMVIPEIEARETSIFFVNLTQEQVNNLVSGFFGIYVKPDTSSQTLQNINRLLPLVWPRVDEETRKAFGLKYGNFVANNYQHEKKLSREFLQLVSAESYIPDDLRFVDIDSAIDDLLSSHRGINNFYSEPLFANQLQRIVGEPRKVPKILNKKYVLSLIECFLTNGNGVAHAAQPVYINLLSNLDSLQANIAVLSFNDMKISSKLQFSLCQTKFKELIIMLKPIITTSAVKDLIVKIDNYSGKLEYMKNDTAIKTIVDSLKVLIQ